jgi:regulatory protein
MAKLQISLKARALRYLSMREHSRSELARKLARYADENDNIEAVLDFLEKAQYLSAERFSESLVHRKQARFGNQRILSELKSHGLTEDAFVHLKSGLVDSEKQRACEVLHRKFPHPPADQQERAKQTRFLLQRGFSGEAVRAAMQAERDADLLGKCDE